MENGKNGIPVIITMDTRRQLADLGYSKEDVSAMKPEEATEIINSQKTKKKDQGEQDTNIDKEALARKIISREGLSPAEQKHLLDNFEEINELTKRVQNPSAKKGVENKSKEEDKTKKFPKLKNKKEVIKNLKKIEEDSKKLRKLLKKGKKNKAEKKYLKLKNALGAVGTEEDILLKKKKRGSINPEAKENTSNDNAEAKPPEAPENENTKNREPAEKPEEKTQPATEDKAKENESKDTIISNEQYAKFVDSGNVENSIIKKIVEKYLKREQLTLKEQAIFITKDKERDLIISNIAVEKSRKSYTDAYKRFLSYKEATTNVFTKTYRKVVGHKYEENELPPDLRRLKTEYNKCLADKGNKLYFYEKRDLEKKGLPKEELKNELQRFINNNIYNEVIVNEQKILSESKTEAWPPKEKSIFRKGVEWYMRQPRTRKLIISCAISTVGFAIFAPSAVAAAGGAMTMMAGRVFRASLSAVVGQIAAKAYDLLIKDKTEQKRKQEEAEIEKYFMNERDIDSLVENKSTNFINENEIDYIKSEHEKIQDRYNKRRRNRLLHKAMVAATAGGVASISTTNLTSGLGHPKTAYADNTGYGEEKYTATEPEIRRIPLKANFSETENQQILDNSYKTDTRDIEKINTLKQEILEKYPNSQETPQTPIYEDLPYEKKPTEPTGPYYKINPAGMEIKEGEPYYRINQYDTKLVEGQPYYRATPPNMEQINAPQDNRTIRVQVQHTENQSYQKQNETSMLREEDQPYYKPKRGIATEQQYDEPQKPTTTSPKIIETGQTTGTNKNIPIEFLSRPGETANQTVQRMIETNPRLAESMGWDHQSELKNFAISASSGSQVLIENPLIASSLSSHNILEMFKYDVDRAIWTPEKLSDEAYGVLLDKHFGGYDIEYVRGINSDAWSHVQNWNASDIFDKKIKIPNEYDNFTKEIRSLCAETGLLPNAASNESWAEFYKRLITYKLTH